MTRVGDVEVLVRELVTAVLESRDADAINAARSLARSESESDRLLQVAEAARSYRGPESEAAALAAPLFSTVRRLGTTSSLSAPELAALARQLDDIGEEVTASALEAAAESKRRRVAAAD